MKTMFFSRLLISLVHTISQKVALIVVFVVVGVFTGYASASSTELILKKDLPYVDVVSRVSLAPDTSVNHTLKNHVLSSSFNPGNFGIPKKIRFPESNRHIDIVSAMHEDNEWKALRGQAHTFITADSRKKTFGQAVIYMRINTLTTKNIGQILHGDMVNIVTTEGWQLGYRVTETADDVSQLDTVSDADESEIIVIQIDDVSGEISAFRGVLENVGERI